MAVPRSHINDTSHSRDRRARETWLAPTVAAIAIAFVGLVYLPDVGHGFLKDDFAWVASAKRLGSSPWQAFAADASGTFYRPIVTLSFAADYAAHELSPFGYALTNLFLLVACALTIALLLHQLKLSLEAAAFAAAVWLVNPHGINMSVLWLSGRTSLLMAWLSCAALLLFLRGRALAGAIVLLGALLSKEDALLVPVILLALLWARGASPARLVSAAAITALPVAVYTALRFRSNALTTDTAPAFYKLTTDPRLILENLLGYLDRSATVFAVVLLVAAVAYRTVPRVPADRRRLGVAAAVWFAAALAITVRVPVRSSLYAIFPSMGIALLFALAIDTLRKNGRGRRGDVVVVILLAALLLASPLYRARNQRWVLAADVSREALAAISSERERLPDAGLVTFEDEPVRFANVQDALGEATTDALRLAVERPLDGRIVPRGDRSTEAVEVARFVLEDGRVRRSK